MVGCCNVYIVWANCCGGDNTYHAYGECAACVWPLVGSSSKFEVHSLLCKLWAGVDNHL